jgi:hypothetical protein
MFRAAWPKSTLVITGKPWSGTQRRFSSSVPLSGASSRSQLAGAPITSAAMPSNTPASLRWLSVPVATGYLPPGDRARHHGPELGLGPLVLERRLEELDPGDPVHVRRPSPGERVVQWARIAEPGEHLRVRADEVVVEQVDDVAGSRAAGRGEHQGHVGVGEQLITPAARRAAVAER